ncbi:hypothetical protein [Proteus mirabilis]|uniref:hypothetical protein n=1 Tax=Proteus mirabilis TaxID=584 RepID=UPI0034D4B1D5
MLKRSIVYVDNSNYNYDTLESKYRIDGFHSDVSRMYTHLVIKITTMFLNKLGEKLQLPKSISKETSIRIIDNHTIDNCEGWLLEIDYFYDEKEIVRFYLEGETPYIEVFKTKYYLEENKEMFPPMYKAMLHNLRSKLWSYWFGIRFIKIRCGHLYYGLGSHLSFFKFLK